FDLRLSRGRSKNNRRKDKSDNGRVAHDHAPSRGRAKTSLPDRALIIDASLKYHHGQPAFSRVVVLIHLRGLPSMKRGKTGGIQFPHPFEASANAPGDISSATHQSLRL